MPPAPLITVVIATYNRPDVLSHTLHSVLQQTEQRWRLLLIGDHCDERTQAVVDTFDDPRIHYINLPARCGEQAGPNSVGLLLADSEYVALLNHDDLWLPDHLQISLACLQDSGAELCVARAAFAHAHEDPAETDNRPRFTEANPVQRAMRHAYTGNPCMFEPCSAWLMRRELISRVGAWRSGRQLYRTTLQDWLMRAWRADARLCCSEPISVIKFNTHHRVNALPTRQLAYTWGNREHDAVSELMSTVSLDALRTLINTDIQLSQADNPDMRDPFEMLRKPPSRLAAIAGRILLSRPAAWFYRLTGRDGFSLYARYWGNPRGSLLESLSRARTGEAMPPTYDLTALLAHAQKELHHHARRQPQ
ncbi:glycosyltransferase [Pseudomonas sp. J452]|uniref:glycosyltransferase family 2 protein n=1 Tax=Pseudomonas sp. J452 TaxID=2898441 RepID=UPI0021AD6427|nr:glycosyltransferase family 2 protein [Pseudomonas sp. J452]UUY09066.1 glycosyltransferase [Pseudomonas sp. J452]